MPQNLRLLTGIEKSHSFPACLSNATHPRATLFVVTDDARAFKAFFERSCAPMTSSGPATEGVDLQENTEFWIMSNAVVINGAFADAESLLPVLAFGWGYMTISQTSDFACPEALATGFGNALGARVTGRPPSHSCPIAERKKATNKSPTGRNSWRPNSPMTNSIPLQRSLIGQSRICSTATTPCLVAC